MVIDEHASQNIPLGNRLITMTYEKLFSKKTSYYITVAKT